MPPGAVALSGSVAGCAAAAVPCADSPWLRDSAHNAVPPMNSSNVMIVSSEPLTWRCARAPWYQASVITTGTPMTSSRLNTRTMACGQSCASLSISTTCSRV